MANQRRQFLIANQQGEGGINNRNFPAISRNLPQFPAIFPIFSESHINLCRYLLRSEIDNLQPKTHVWGIK
jgi:hypothetical protein